MKSTPTTFPSTAAAARKDSDFSNSVSSCISGSEPCDTLLLKSPSTIGLFIEPNTSPAAIITLTS